MLKANIRLMVCSLQDGDPLAAGIGTNVDRFIVPVCRMECDNWKTEIEVALCSRGHVFDHRTISAIPVYTSLFYPCLFQARGIWQDLQLDADPARDLACNFNVKDGDPLKEQSAPQGEIMSSSDARIELSEFPNSRVWCHLLLVDKRVVSESAGDEAHFRLST